MDSTFLNKYRDRMCSIMMQMRPDWDEKKVKHKIEKMIDKRLINPTVELDNNVTHEHRESKLLSVIDWTFDRKPIIAGNGTFYKNQYEAINPTRSMLDGMADSRANIKKIMYKMGDLYGIESDEYKDQDRFQNIEKVNMNSWYGGSGAKCFAFYSKWSGPATTLTAQSVISTAETLFESFLADNYAFLNLTEVMEWIKCVLKEEDNVLDNFIQRKTAEEVTERLYDKIIEKDNLDEDILYRYLSSLNEDILTKIYYKNNMIEFMKDHHEIKDILLNILENIENNEYVDENDDEWLKKIPNEYLDKFSTKKASDWNKFVNKMYFMDPNDPPDNIKDDLKLLNNYFVKYCYVKYLSFDRIYRLRNFNRRVVTVIDTDSNFLSLDTLVNYIYYDIIGDRTFGRPVSNNDFIVVNTLTYVITDVIQKILYYYGKMSNVPKEFRYYFNMKNEFYNSILIIGLAKKRYISKQILREGNLLKPPKTDIKGFDFKKATCSEAAESVFMDIINRRIINSDPVDYRGMINDIREFKIKVKDSILNGETLFLPNGNAKELEGYKDPSSIPSIRGVLTWNMIETENMIDLPSKVCLLKMNIFKLEDMSDLEKTHPEIYKIFLEKIFRDETGIFVTKKWDPGIDYVYESDKKWRTKIPQKYRTRFKSLGPKKWNEFVDKCTNEGKDMNGTWVYKQKGIQILSIPSNGKIPDWAMPYIDYTTMINNVLAPFKPVLEIFGAQFIEEGRSRNSVNRITSTPSNILKF